MQISGTIDIMNSNERKLSVSIIRKGDTMAVLEIKDLTDIEKKDLVEALGCIASMMSRTERTAEKFAQGTSQNTLQRNRLNALKIASSLISQELAENGILDCHAKEDLEKAVAPIASLISKSQKAQKKLAQGTWQHKMLSNNLKALYIASPLLSKALSEISAGKEQTKY